jgi:hypothetical protein
MMVPLGIKPISPKPTVMVYAGPADGLKPAADGVNRRHFWTIVHRVDT